MNAILMRSHLEMTATLCVLAFPPDRQTMVVANAGHIPPLIVHDGVASYLEHGSPLLGVEYPPEESMVMPRSIGDRILLMTDGLVERRGEDMTAAMDRLARDFGGTMSLGAEQIADQLMEQWGAARTTSP